ncbi:MAG TPA: hypothetical protein PKM91_15560, partial [Cyclobacteriaceae bacterium]|nr:hypothetical protein [Cyclobacteriaceae bacterium]
MLKTGFFNVTGQCFETVFESPTTVAIIGGQVSYLGMGWMLRIALQGRVAPSSLPALPIFAS